jgi:DNA-binding MarR family transcriptional regulator
MARRAPPLKPSTSLVFSLDRLAGESANRLRAAIAGKFDLDLAQWRIVAELGDDGGSTAQAISRSSGMHKSTVSRAVAALLAAGWIELHEDSADGRRAILQLTAKGRRAYAAVAPLANSAERQILTSLGRSRRSVLRALEKLQAALAEDS